MRAFRLIQSPGPFRSEMAPHVALRAPSHNTLANCRDTPATLTPVILRYITQHTVQVNQVLRVNERFPVAFLLRSNDRVPPLFQMTSALAQYLFLDRHKPSRRRCCDNRAHWLSSRLGDLQYLEMPTKLDVS